MKKILHELEFRKNICIAIKAGKITSEDAQKEYNLTSSDIRRWISCDEAGELVQMYTALPNEAFMLLCRNIRRNNNPFHFSRTSPDLRSFIFPKPDGNLAGNGSGSQTDYPIEFIRMVCFAIKREKISRKNAQIEFGLEPTDIQRWMSCFNVGELNEKFKTIYFEDGELLRYIRNLTPRFL